MANLMNHNKQQHINYMTGIGQKVKHLAKLGGHIKGIYEGAKQAFAIGTAVGEAIVPILPLIGL